MTLEELSKCYEDAAVPLRARLAELRHQMTLTSDPEELWHLNRRIADLTPMLTQMNDLSWLLAHYYEIGGSDHDSRYGFNGKRKAKSIHPAEDEDLDPNARRRINRFAKADLLGVSLREQDHDPDSGGARSEQKHHQPDAEKRGEESGTIHEVFPDLSQFFDGTPKRHNRRIT